MNNDILRVTILPRLRKIRSTAVSVFLVVLFGWAFHELTWSGIPAREHSALVDSRQVLFGLAAAFLLLTYLPRRLGGFFGGMLATVASLFVVLNWFHIAFYRDIIVPSSFEYGLDALDGLSSVSNLGPVWTGIFGVLGCGLIGWAASIRWFGERPKAGPVVIAAIFAAVALQNGIKFQEKYSASLPVGGMHPIAGFVRAAFSGLVDEPTEAQLEALVQAKPVLQNQEFDKKYPLFGDVGPDIYASAVPEKSNVIVVMMESVRSSETGFAGGKTGVTPRLDEIAKETAQYTNFYANTTQTVRAEMALLCSTLDYNRGAPLASTGAQLKNRCLPRMLADRGYSTHWFHGNENSFFQRDSFLPQTGIADLHDENRMLTARPDASLLGWGVVDTEVIDYSMDHLESLDAPFFAEILTVSNHFPFKWDWESTGVDFSSIKTDHELSNYHKGIYYTDHAVGQFWDRFKQSHLYDNTIVVFVGDHGIWLFDDQDAEGQNEFKRNEDYSRVPLLVYVPGEQPVTRTVAASQLDIAPTILGMLGIRDQSAFLGRDLNAALDDDFIVLTRIGAAGFRKGDIACYASQTSCESKYQKCDISDDFNTTCGVAAAESPDYGTILELNPTLRQEMGVAQRVMNYSNAAHHFGFVPPSILDGQVPVQRWAVTATLHDQTGG